MTSQSFLKVSVPVGQMRCLDGHRTGECGSERPGGPSALRRAELAVARAVETEPYDQARAYERPIALRDIPDGQPFFRYSMLRRCHPQTGLDLSRLCQVGRQQSRCHLAA